MKISDALLKQMEQDMSLDVPFSKGQTLPVKNCWHFYTDGSKVDFIFQDEDDFIAGMNRVCVVSNRHPVTILAFALMDTHVHFVLYGSLVACQRFMLDYVRRTSIYIVTAHQDRHKLQNTSIQHQAIIDSLYLKTAICYTLRNPPVGGIPYNYYDYPWSSGSLYFRRPSLWTSPMWMHAEGRPLKAYPGYVIREKLKSKAQLNPDTLMLGELVFPGEYVAYRIVERIFKTCRSFHFFMCTTKELKFESLEGVVSRLSIPIQEMRQHRDDICRSLFGHALVKSLTIEQRIVLGKTLRGRFNSSVKQIARLVGLKSEDLSAWL